MSSARCRDFRYTLHPIVAILNDLSRIQLTSKTAPYLRFIVALQAQDSEVGFIRAIGVVFVNVMYLNCFPTLPTYAAHTVMAKHDCRGDVYRNWNAHLVSVKDPDIESNDAVTAAGWGARRPSAAAGHEFSTRGSKLSGLISTEASRAHGERHSGRHCPLRRLSNRTLRAGSTSRSLRFAHWA